MSLDDFSCNLFEIQVFKAKKHFEDSRKLAKMAYHIDQRSIRCWVKSKLQSALKLQCFLAFS